ncbi:hypothetical protein F4695_004447 [Rhizobium soli]|uniref:CobB/CobQ-like glutamine amidotransferase domain-containing protein n=1 Tax=Rhizobium soli TaxID=424798 RepID=A0A7X0MTH8_9HYPH|nr:BPL-N domain-containing protein [Rhizobium soli]MBB6511052.1 hypothetical protein [Rhizobium soli]
MTSFGLADRGAFSGDTLTFLNRCRLHGIGVNESDDGFEIAAVASNAAARFGLTPLGQPAGECRNPELLSSAPRIAIYAGEAVGYPYWGYYSHALLSIGLSFHAVTGADVAAACLNDYDLLVMPGGFATWGLDRAEDMDGIDAAIAAFVRDGGSYIGSCGGAFYMSEGRPGWHGAIDAMPKFTQEYLMTGAAVLGISVDGPVIGRGLPETVELPYYHGPIYAEAKRSTETLGRFGNYISESRLFIENPLSPTLFDKEMKDTPAIFMAPFGKGNVLTFSPHPEMGELVRKGVALEGYIRHYLPIRGFKVMDQTLRFFMKEDCAGFRLIHNAIACLGLFDRVQATAPLQALRADDLGPILLRLDTTMARQFAAISDMAATETDAMQEIVAAEASRLRSEWAHVCASLRYAVEVAPIDSRVATGLSSVLHAAAQVQHKIRLAELIVMTELPIRLVAAALRIIACDRALGAEEITE